MGLNDFAFRRMREMMRAPLPDNAPRFDSADHAISWIRASMSAGEVEVRVAFADSTNAMRKYVRGMLDYPGTDRQCLIMGDPAWIGAGRGRNG